MTTKAQNRATVKYRSNCVKQVNVPFYPKEEYIYEFLCQQPNKAGYIKGLILKDMGDEVSAE